MRNSKRRVRVSKKTGINKSLAILLDSSYLLPVFGIEVREINDSILLELRGLALRKLIEMYYSPISLIEIVSKVARETMRKGQGLSQEEIESTIRIIEESEYLKPIYPCPRAYALAYRMKLLGHRDMIDNILYAIATLHGLIFLTLDQKLRKFIQRHKIKGANMLTHNELLEIAK